MTKHLRLISMAAGLMLAGMVSAQQISIPYSMGFEEADSLEWQNWHINMGANAAACNDQWIIGTDEKSEGTRSLYISNNDTNAVFGVGPNIQFAYRDFVLPQGTYIIAFDWKCMGSEDASLYVGCGPVSTQMSCEAIINGQPLPQAYTQWCQTATMEMRGQRYWQNARLTGINSNGTRVLRLFFAWVSTNTETDIFMPISACIDNLQICRANINPPTNLEVVGACDSTIVTWNGSSDTYQFGYRRMGDEQWHNRSGITATMGVGQAVVENLEEGIYDFRVRGIVANDTSVYTYNNAVAIFCPEAHCINYIDIHDTTGTIVCRTGTVSSSGVINPTQTRIQVVDYGPDASLSRHTVNWDIAAYDKNTNYKLPKIPTGELATVRLGNWETGAQWESITYNYLVDSVYSVLFLKYAVVLEDPSHNHDEQPRFTLSIKDMNGDEVDASCGSADFRAGANAGNKGSGWHQEVIQDPTYPSSTTVVTWKEWTTYGVDLTPFIGQTLQITVTTYDCTLSGHFGYGYFCLGCAAAKIEGISCGADSKLVAQAPDGFSYEWTSIHDSLTVVSTERTLEVDVSDTTTYRCRLTYLDQADCYFDLYSSVLPRFPVAALSYKYEPANCENRVAFTNQSHIMVKYEGDPDGTHHYDEPCEQYEWVINGEKFSDNNPVYIFPQSGGQFPVTLTAYIANCQCWDDTTFIVDIPAIGDVYLNLSDSICYGSRYNFGDQTLTTSGVYNYTTKSRAGCDSICTLNLTVLDQSLTNLADTNICAETTYVLDGDVYPYKTSRQWIRHKQNQFGCDSTVVQNVTLLDTIKPVVNVKEIVEDGDLGAFYFSGSGYSYYTVNGVRHTEDSITDLTPDTYLIIFYNDFGCEKAYTYNLDPGCIGGIVYQRWNDVLSVKNPTYANGRSYVKYQWIEDGLPIPGATKSYYYAPNGLNFAAIYEVQLTDSLGNEFLSCSYRPIQLVSDAPSLSPTNVHRGGEVWLQTGTKAWVECYNASGLKMFAEEVTPGRTALQMPMLSGMYIVTVYLENDKESFRVCVTE